MATVRKSLGWMGLVAVSMWSACVPEQSTPAEQAATPRVEVARTPFTAAEAPPARFTYPPLQTTLAQYSLEIDPKLLERFEKDEDTPKQPAVLITPDGTRYNVKMRLRGNSSRGWPKKSWRVELPKGTKLDGRRKFNLLSGYRDSTLMIEKLGYDMLAAMGVPASKATYIRLVINGKLQGVYLDLERVDKPFLQNHGFVDTEGTIYRCGGKNCEMKAEFDKTYQRDWEVSTPEEGSKQPLLDFLETLNATPEPEFVQALTQRFELENYLRILAMDALITNSTVEDSRSYVVHDAGTGRISYVPWDLNNTDAKYVPSTPPGKIKTADAKHPLFNFSLFDSRVEEEYLEREKKEPGRFRPIFSNLNTRIFLNPALREQEMVLLEQAMADLFTPQVLHARIDAIHALLAPTALAAPHTDVAQFNDGPRYLKKYMQERTTFLRQQMATWRAWKPGLVLQAVNARQGWIELRNLGTKKVSTAGLVISTDLRNATRRNVPTHTLQPGQTLRLTQSQLGLKLPLKGALGLFSGKGVSDAIDALYYGELPAGQYYSRAAQTPTRWEVR